jgi:hypothetical protein
MSSHSPSTDNPPWNPQRGSRLGLKIDTFPRNTSAPPATIQTIASTSEVTAPIHHHIADHSFPTRAPAPEPHPSILMMQATTTASAS